LILQKLFFTPPSPPPTRSSKINLYFLLPDYCLIFSNVRIHTYLNTHTHTHTPYIYTHTHLHTSTHTLFIISNYGHVWFYYYYLLSFFPTCKGVGQNVPICIFNFFFSRLEQKPTRHFYIRENQISFSSKFIWVFFLILILKILTAFLMELLQSIISTESIS